MTDTEFMQEIKTRVRKAYLFFGEEVLCRQYALDRLEAMHDDPAGINHDRLAAPDASAVINACETLPLMAEKRLVMVMDAKPLWAPSEAERLIEYLPNMPDTATLALVCTEADKRTALYKAIEKWGAAVECAPRSETQAAAFAVDRAQALGTECTRRTALLLIEMVGTGLNTINAELEKICHYAPGEPLSEKTLRICVNPRIEYRIFDMLDAFLRGQMDKAMAELSKMLTDTHPLQIIAFMAGRLRLLCIGLRALEEGKREAEAIAIMGGSAYAAQKLLAHRKRMTRKRCERAIIRLADLDYAIKSGQREEQTGLLSALVEIFSV